MHAGMGRRRSKDSAFSRELLPGKVAQESRHQASNLSLLSSIEKHFVTARKNLPNLSVLKEIVRCKRPSHSKAC